MIVSQDSFITLCCCVGYDDPCNAAMASEVVPMLADFKTGKLISLDHTEKLSATKFGEEKKGHVVKISGSSRQLTGLSTPLCDNDAYFYLQIIDRVEFYHLLFYDRWRIWDL